MNIRDVHAKLVDLIGALTVDDPVSSQVQKVWKFTPPASLKITTTPTAILMYDLMAVRFRPNGLTEQDYDVHLQLFVTKLESDADAGQDLASAYQDALVTMLSAHQRLDGVVDVVHGMKGARPGYGTLTRLTWGDAPYVGLDVLIPITLHDNSRARGV